MLYPPSRLLSRICFLLLSILPLLAWSNSFSQPAITTVTSPSSGIYTVGNHIDFVVNLNQPVNVTLGAESPYIPITLDTGTNARANYFSGTGTNTLVFRYTVENTHKDYNGLVLGTSIVLSSSTISNGTNEALILSLNGVASTIGLKVDGIVPKLIYNQPVGNFPTTKRNIQFLLKFNKIVTGLSLNSFELEASPSITASLSSFKKLSDTVYSVWVSDQTTSSNYTGTIKLNIKPSFVSTIKDNLNQNLDVSTVAAGSAASIQFPLAITVTSFLPTPHPFSGGIVKIVGTNFGRVDKVMIGNVESKILFNNDINLDLLVMPGSDTLDGTLKIVRGTDTIYPILDNASYKATKTNFPIAPLNKLDFTNSSSQKTYSNFAIDKNGKFAIVCDEFNNGGAGLCAIYFNDYSTNLNQRVGWRQVGQRFRYPDYSINYAGFGSAIAIGANGNHIAIAAKNASSGKGEVIIYNVNLKNIYNTNNNSNTPIDSILTVDHIVSGSTIFDNFGASIEMSADGNTLMVGAPQYDTNNGAVFVYKKFFDLWSQLTIINKPSDAIGASVNFGSTIALSADGDKAFITAINDNGGKGAVWGFQNATTNWTQLVTKITASNYTNTGYFGSSIALSANANKIIIGAPIENNTKGAIYHFNRSNNLISQVGGPITDTTSDITSEFGTSLSMSANGDLFAVSAPLNNRGAYFIYGIQKDSIELLSSTINKSTDSIFNKRVQLDYQGNSLLTEVAYTNGDKYVTGFEALPKPEFRSLNRNYISSNTSDTLIAKLYNARSVSKVLFGDSIILKYQALTDSTIAILIDSTINNTKKRINLKYGFENNYTDSVLIDRTKPTVKVLFNKNKPFNDTTFQAKLRFNKKIATNVLTNFPLYPNKVNGAPTARLDSVKVDTAGLVYIAYYKALISGPIFLMDTLNNTYSDSVGNGSLPLLRTDTIVYDAVTLRPMLYVNRNSIDSILVSFLVPEIRAPGSLKLTFSKFSNDSLITTWVISNTYTQSGEFVVNLNDNPLSNPFITGVLPNNSILQKGKYTVRFTYQDTLFNPIGISESWIVNLRDSLPTVYTYSPDYNNAMSLLTIKGKYFSSIDSLKIGNKIPAAYSIVNDSLIYIENKTGTRTGDLQFFYQNDRLDPDSTVNDFNFINGGINAVDTLVINKVWQKFRNIKKGRLNKIKLRLLNNSTTIDNKIILEIHKDTVVTTSLDPTVKFTKPPILKSDTLSLLKNTSLTFKSFIFTDSTVILDDSTDYFIVVKQINNATENTFKILADLSISKTGAINVNDAELQYQIATRPFVVIDTIPPKVKVIFNKIAPFNDTVFQAKLRFSERVVTDIATYFPLLSNGFNGQPTARLDSVKVDTAGWVYTAYFKALISGPIYLMNPNFAAFEDSAGNRSLPIISTDTIIFDKITLAPSLYLARLTTNLYNIGIEVPENITHNSLKLNFYDFTTDTIFHSWVLSNTITSTYLYDINILTDPTTYPFVTAISGAPQLRNGKYRLRLSYQDYLSNPVAISPSWNINYRDSLPTIYTYESETNKQIDSILLKGVHFSNIDSIKIGNSAAQYRILNDSLLLIDNSKGIVANNIIFYYDSDSTTNDVNIIKGGKNANTAATIKKAWQKFYNLKKGRLRNIFLNLQNTSTSINHRMVIEIFKDTNVTSSLNPLIKFNSAPLAVSDTSVLSSSMPNSYQQFTFLNDTLLLEDSTNYFFVLKQLDNAEASTFKILVDQNNSSFGANNEVKVDLKYDVITTPYLLMDQYPPSVKISFNKQGAFSDSAFQVKLRFSEKISTTINNGYFPIIPNAAGSSAMARFDSVRIDTVGLVYTGYFKALQNGPIYFSNPSYYAFSDFSGNISLPIPNSDTIYFDRVTIPAALYTNPIVVDSLTLEYNFPEKIGPGSPKLVFTNLATGALVVTWNLKDSLQNLSIRNINPFLDPTSFNFVRSVSPSNARLTYGSYRMSLIYQDTLFNPVSTSSIWDIRIISRLPIVYEYSPEVNSRFNDLKLKGINFTYVDSVKINNKKVTFTIVSDSTMTIQDKVGSNNGYIHFYYDGDSTILDANKIYGAVNASNQYTISKTWQKFYNNYKGALNSIKLKLLNISTTIDNKLLLEVHKDTLVTSSLDPSLKFNNQPLVVSDTINLLRNSSLSEKVFNFTNATIILKDSTNYYFVLKQINNVGVTTSKVLGEPTSLKNGAINDAFSDLYFEIATKPYVYIDTVPPIGNIVNTNLNRAVSGPFWVDLVFNEPVNDLLPSQRPLIPSIKFGQPAATADSIKTISPNFWYRQYFTPLQEGTIYLFNVDAGVTRDLAGNNSLPIGIDSVNYIGNNFKLSDYDYPYTIVGNSVTLKGNGFKYIEEVKLNNQVIADSVINDSTMLITIPNNAVSGPLVLKNIAGDSTNNKLVSILNTGTSNINPDTLNLKFIPIRTGAIDSLQFYLTNGSVNNTAYQLQVFDHNGDKKYTRMIASSDTVLLNQNIVQQKTNFNFPQKHFVVFKDSIYYIRFVKINHSNTSATILGGSNGIPRYNYAVNARILIANSPMSFTISNNSVNGVVFGNYYIDFLFDRPLRSAFLPLMIPGLDSNNNVLARVDSTVISNDGLRYRQFITPLKQGKILFFSANFGAAYDYYGYATPPFGFDTVTFKNVKKPFIKKYNFTPVSTGRVINLIGKNLTNVKKILIGITQATHYVNNDDTLTFISPLNAGSGRIQIIDVNNDTVPNLVDTLYKTANTLKLAHQAWQEFVIPRTGLIHKVGINFQNTSTVNAKFQLKIYNKDQSPSSLLSSVKFDNAFLVSDTISVIAGQNNIKYFTFKKSDPIVALDSHFYFVIHQLDENQNIQIKTDLTIEQGHDLKGSAGGVAAKLYHTLEMESFLKIDTIKPVPVLKVQKQVVTGSFYVDLTYTKPVDQYDPNPIVVDAFNNLPKATLDSTKVLEPGLKFRYFYKPVYKGQIKFIIPNQFAAIDFAGNGSDISNLASLYVVDTTIKNVVRALGELSVCEGDSVQLLTAIDSALEFEWNTLSTQRLITTKSSGAFFIRIKIDSNLYYNSDTLNVTIRNNPIAPILSRSGDVLVSSAKHNNKWYKNNTLLSDSINTVKPNASAIYTVRKIEDGCLSAPSTAYSFTFVNIDSLKSIVTNRPPNFCIGDSVVLSYVNNTFKQFKWSTGDTTKSIVVKKAGTYFVQFQLDSTYTFMSDSIQVKVFDIPAKPVISRTGDSIRSTSLFGNIWYKNTTQLLDTNNRIKPSQSDYYSVKVALNGCVSVLSQPYYYIITGIGMLNNYSSSIHPNPFIDQVYIDNRFNSPGKLTLEVINISNGKKVKSIELLNNMNKVNLPTLAGGLYLFNVINASGTILHQQKLIKL